MLKLISIKLLKLNEFTQLQLPHYKLTEELSKTSLINYINNHGILKDYLPDDCKSTDIDRNYILNVFKIIKFTDYLLERQRQMGIFGQSCK